LPPKEELSVFIGLTDRQSRSYRRVIQHYNSSSDTAGSSLNAITKLTKVCIHPSLLTEAELDGEAKDKDAAIERAGWDSELHQASGKFLFLALFLSTIRSTTTDKVVLVSNYTSALDLLALLCKHYSYPFLRLDGNTKVSGNRHKSTATRLPHPPVCVRAQTENRQVLVDQFNRDALSPSDPFVFLLSSKAGGVGLNMIGANRLVLVDAAWNPAVDLQAMARVWREGQKKDVKIYRLFHSGTMDEKIYQRQISKNSVAGSVTAADGGGGGSGGASANDGGSGSTTGKFTQDELKEIFSLKANRATGRYWCDTALLMGQNALLSSYTGPASCVGDNVLRAILTQLEEEHEAGDGSGVAVVTYVSSSCTAQAERDAAAVHAAVGCPGQRVGTGGAGMGEKRSTVGPSDKAVAVAPQASINSEGDSTLIPAPSPSSNSEAVGWGIDSRDMEYDNNVFGLPVSDKSKGKGMASSSAQANFSSDSDSGPVRAAPKAKLTKKKKRQLSDSDSESDSVAAPARGRTKATAKATAVTGRAKGTAKGTAKATAKATALPKGRRKKCVSSDSGSDISADFDVSDSGSGSSSDESSDSDFEVPVGKTSGGHGRGGASRAGAGTRTIADDDDDDDDGLDIFTASGKRTVSAGVGSVPAPIVFSAEAAASAPDGPLDNMQFFQTPQQPSASPLTPAAAAGSVATPASRHCAGRDDAGGNDSNGSDSDGSLDLSSSDSDSNCGNGDSDGESSDGVAQKASTSRRTTVRPVVFSATAAAHAPNGPIDASFKAAAATASAAAAEAFATDKDGDVMVVDPPPQQKPQTAPDDDAAPPPWTFTAVENNLGKGLTLAGQEQSERRARELAVAKELKSNKRVGLDIVAVLCGLDPIEVAEAEAAAKAKAPAKPTAREEAVDSGSSSECELSD
jgi:hypothetical protein